MASVTEPIHELTTAEIRERYEAVYVSWVEFMPTNEDETIDSLREQLNLLAAELRSRGEDPYA